MATGMCCHYMTFIKKKLFMTFKGNANLRASCDQFSPSLKKKLPLSKVPIFQCGSQNLV